jgi:hypothetical protein
MNLGVSVDIVRAAVAKARMVIAQPNSFMPVVQGDGWCVVPNVWTLYTPARKLHSLLII